MVVDRIAQMLAAPLVRAECAARFWKKVDSAGADDCWLWTAGVYGYRKPYGSAHLPGLGSARAHRVSYALHHGVSPAQMMVCHRCDNPRCVNPSHLFLGTALDNNRDMMRKGRYVPSRSRVGARQPLARLSDNQVREIRASKLRGWELAAIYGGHKTTMNAIKRRAAYAFVPD